MAVSNKFISNKEAIPSVETDLFADNPHNKYALGLLGYGVQPDNYTDLFQAYLKLRANVYIDQTGMLQDSHRRDDGTEMDSDDERSLHIAVVENRLGISAVMACMRLIIKSRANDQPLPVEALFPESFHKTKAPLKSVEVSRFIIRHNDREHEAAIRSKMLNASLAYAAVHDLGPAFAVVEPAFADHLTRLHVPFEPISEVKRVDEYNDDNVGIKIDGSEMMRRSGGRRTLRRQNITLGSYDFWGNL